VSPTPPSLAGADGPSLTGKNQKCRLKRVFNVMLVL
jgi:hypothetical protein